MQITTKIHKATLQNFRSTRTFLFINYPISLIPLNFKKFPLTPNYQGYSPILNSHYFFLYVKDTFFWKAKGDGFYGLEI